MLAHATVHARDGDVGPHHAVWAEHHAGVGDAVAAERTTFTQQGPELAKAAWKTLTVNAEVNFPTIVAQVAELRPRSEVHVLAEDGIADIVEVRGFGARQQNRVFHFGGVSNDGIGTDPRKFSHIRPASHGGPGANVARSDQRGAGFDHRCFVDDDPVPSGEKSGVIAFD